MPLFKAKPKVTKQQALAARPLRAVDGEMKPADGGAGKLTVRLRPTRWSGWLFRMPEGATKTFEFDPMGVLVWENCDGKTSVQQIIRKLARRYGLSLREAEVSTRQFLVTLARKGLIALAVDNPDKKDA